MSFRIINKDFLILFYEKISRLTFGPLESMQQLSSHCIFHNKEPGSSISYIISHGYIKKFENACLPNFVYVARTFNGILLDYSVTFSRAESSVTSRFVRICDLCTCVL